MSPKTAVVLRDRRAGEADEQGVRQSLTQVAGVPVGYVHLAGLRISPDAPLEAVLRAVGLVGNHDDIVPVC
jgi:hypothetical protein